MKYDLKNKDTVGMARLADFFLVLTLLFVAVTHEVDFFGTKKIAVEQSKQQSKSCVSTDTRVCPKTLAPTPKK